MSRGGDSDICIVDGAGRLIRMVTVAEAIAARERKSARRGKRLHDEQSAAVARATCGKAGRKGRAK